MRRLVLLLLVTQALAFGAEIAYAEDFCHLELEFEDLSTGAPIPGILLRLENPALSLNREVSGGPDGRVLVWDLAPGIWRAEAIPEGYQWLSVGSLRCVSGGLIHLAIRLQRSEGDEGVSLGDAPEIDASSAEAVIWAPLPDESLPREMVAPRSARTRAVGVSKGPKAFRRWDLLPPGIQRPLSEENWSAAAPGLGSLELGIGGGAGGKTLRSRGRSQKVDQEIPVLLNWALPLAKQGRAYLFAEGVRRSFGSWSGMSADWDGSTRRNESLERSGSLAMKLESGGDGSFAIDGFGNFSDSHHSQEAATLFTLDEIPRFNHSYRNLGFGGGWRWMIGGNALLHGGVEWVRSRGEIDPEGAQDISQDLDPEGAHSSGFGRGVFFGMGSGVPKIRDRRESFETALALSFSPAEPHLIDFKASYSRVERIFQPGSSSIDSPVSAAFRMRYENSSNAYVDLLYGVGRGRGISSRLRLSFRDIWRIGKALTLRTGLRMESRDYDAGEGRPGLHFDPGQTLSPEIALVWDFAGGARSRAWLSWARSRPKLGEDIRLRLAGSLESGVTALPWDQASVEDPIDIAVDPGLDPPRLDLFGLGVERELLAHLRLGAVISLERFRDGVALLQPGDGAGYLLAAPRPGPLWLDALERDTMAVSLWVRKTPSSRWQGLLHLGWVQQTGTWEGDYALDLTDPEVEFSSDILRPASLENARGPLDGDRRFSAECEASWNADSGLRLGGRLFWGMGAPLSRRGAIEPGFGLDRRFVEARGSAGRGPSTWQVDINLMLPLAEGGPDLRIEVLNLFFQQKAVEIDQRWSLLSRDQARGLTPEEQLTPGSFGKALRYQRPPEARLSLIWRW